MKRQKFEVVNEMIVQATMDTGACYGVKKCAEIVFRKSKMVLEKDWLYWKKEIDALNPSNNKI